MVEFDAIGFFLTLFGRKSFLILKIKLQVERLQRGWKSVQQEREMVVQFGFLYDFVILSAAVFQA
jgi:hypothetical protein